MARVRTNQVVVPISIDPMDAIVQRIRAGSVVPIIGGSLAHDLVLGGHDEIDDAYAVYCRNQGFELASNSLAEMLQFRGVADENLPDLRYLKEDYVNFIKNRLVDMAEAAAVDSEAMDEIDANFESLSLSQVCDTLGFPSFDERSNPYVLLAALNLPIYITTSSHGLLEMALQRAGREPQTEICRWRPGLETQLPPILGGDYEPSREKPLVYHLFGYDEDPASLVLTEDDHLNFLVAVSENLGNDHDPVHKRVRLALAESSLLLLGYSLRDWETRILFRGLIVPRTRLIADDPATGVVNIQLRPGILEENYLNRYLDRFSLDVSWRDVAEYLADLYSRVDA